MPIDLSPTATRAMAAGLRQTDSFERSARDEEIAVWLEEHVVAARGKEIADVLRERAAEIRRGSVPVRRPEGAGSFEQACAQHLEALAEEKERLLCPELGPL